MIRIIHLVKWITFMIAALQVSHFVLWIIYYNPSIFTNNLELNEHMQYIYSKYKDIFHIVIHSMLTGCKIGIRFRNITHTVSLWQCLYWKYDFETLRILFHYDNVYTENTISKHYSYCFIMTMSILKLLDWIIHCLLDITFRIVS